LGQRRLWYRLSRARSPAAAAASSFCPSGQFFFNSLLIVLEARLKVLATDLTVALIPHHEHEHDKFAPRSLRANDRLVIGMTPWGIQRLLMRSWIDLYIMLTISIWPANH
jgi:hypothetical protein